MCLMLGPAAFCNLSHLSKLTPGTAHKNNNTTGRADQKHQTGTRREKASGGQQQQEGEGAREGSKDRREEAAQAKEKAHAALTVS